METQVPSGPAGDIKGSFTDEGWGGMIAAFADSAGYVLFYIVDCPLWIVETNITFSERGREDNVTVYKTGFRLVKVFVLKGS